MDSIGVRGGRRVSPMVIMFGTLCAIVAGLALIATGSSGSPAYLGASSASATASPTTSPRWVYASHPPDSVTETPGVIATPVAPVLQSEPFRSPIYHYSLRPPEHWEAKAATAPWDGAKAWGTAMADTFDSGSPFRHLTVVATRLPKGMTAKAWTEAHSQGMPTEFEAVGGHHHCVFHRGGGTRITEGASVVLADGVIDGRPAQIRTICGHITASVAVGRRIYQLSLFVSPLPNGDRALFDAIMATVDFDPPAPATGYQSARYTYGLQVPGGWTTTPATESWIGSGRPTSTAADTFVGPDAMGAPRLTVAAQTKPDPTSEDRFTAASAPLPAAVRVDGPTVTCAFGDSIIERGPIPSVWDVDVIGGHRARVRTLCGTVDAVVFVGNRGYLFTLESGHSTTGDMERLHGILASIRFDDGLVRYVSDAYGYSMRFPRGWDATPASKPWAGGSATDGVDRFAQGPDGSFARFGVAALALAPDETEDGWIATHVPRIKELFGTTCRFGSTHVLAPEADASWGSATIDGRKARLRAACGRVDGVVFSAGIGYWLRLSSPEHRTGGDVSAFNALADTIDLEAVPPIFIHVGQAPAGPTKTFSSARYGYTIRIPADWATSRARKRWNGSGAWVARMADRFAKPFKSPSRFSVTARPLRGRVLDEAWLAAYVTDPSLASGTICRSADGTPRSYWRYVRSSGGATWREALVAGRPARIRGLCGQVQAVLQVGDTVFVLTSYRSDTDEWAFRQIADTFRASP